MASTITYSLSIWNQQQILSLDMSNDIIHFSNNVTVIEPKTITLAPSYFDSRGQVYITMSSPYLKYFKVLKLDTSLDNDTWIEVQQTSEIPKIEDTSKFTFIGWVDLTQLKIKIYLRLFAPPQTVTHPSNITTEQLTSFNVSIWIHPVLTPKDYTLLGLVFISLLGASYGILYSFLKKEKYY